MEAPVILGILKLDGYLELGNNLIESDKDDRKSTGKPFIYVVKGKR